MLLKKISKIAIAVAMVALLVCLVAIPVSAIYSGQPVHKNIDGNYINPFVNFSTLRYIDVLSSGTAGWKDFPVSRSYNIAGFSNFGGIGKVLYNTMPYQNISGSNVKQTPALGSNFEQITDINRLDASYGAYLTDGGYIDVNVIEITCNPNLATTYQRLYVVCDDIYLTKDMFNGVVDGTYNYNLYSPRIMTFSSTPNYAYDFSIEGVCEYVDINGDRLSMPFSTSITVHTGNEIAGGLYYRGLNIIGACRNALPDDPKESLAVCLKDVTIKLGTINDYVPLQITGGDYSGGALGYRIIQPSLRTNLTASQTKDIYETDINTYVERYFDELGGLQVKGTAFGNFASEAISGFLSMSIFPGLTIGGILFTFLAIAITMAVLKYFAGG